jgi:hypothetical protein
MRELVATGLLLLLAIVPAACDSGAVGNEGDVVGGPCTLSGDCDEDEGSLCLSDQSFPGGTCTQRCEVADDCPDDTTCIRKTSGICLLNCTSDGDCRSGYVCAAQPKIDGSSDAGVCLGPANPDT